VVNRKPISVYQTDAVLISIDRVQRRRRGVAARNTTPPSATVQSTSMSRKSLLALLAGASFLGVPIHPVLAFDADAQEPRVIFADQPPQPVAPVRTANAGRSSMGGGFIEFLFGDHQQQAGRYPQQPVYQQPAESQRRLFPQAWPQQSMPEPEQAFDPMRRPFYPKYERQLVEYHGKESPGTIIIDTPNKFLFLVQGDGYALRYGIGVGRPGFTWSGVKTISAKREWPDWTPPAEMLARRPDLPRHMEGGPQNPLGARAMYLGSSLYRIHGSNEPWTIGTNVSSGCIRMRNQDVIDLYDRVNVGARVVVI
jgi:lipoprotein-anchoring transpeptidase ErfK/SrfK